MNPGSLHLHRTSVNSHAGAEFFCRQIACVPLAPSGGRLRILVAGSGSGHEAVYLQQRLDALVDAVDFEVAPHEEYRNRPGVRYCSASVECLPFAEESFDAIFYHHVIEHVGDPARSLAEIARVSRRNGWMFIGTPNRTRLVSAVGAHDQSSWKATLANKLRENAYDWRARLTGKFRNELGAHAGFSTTELDSMLAPFFSERRWLTREYLRFKYDSPPASVAVRALTLPAVLWVAAPSIYALCRRAAVG